MIRKTTIEDLDQIYQLMCLLENKQLDYTAFRQIYINQYDSPQMISFVDERDEKLTAFLNLRMEQQLHHCEKIAEIMELVVDEGYRSQGIGKELFQYACMYAKDNGCAQIELATNQLRHQAHRFYEREGMSNFHYKYSMRLDGESFGENKIGN